MSNGTTHVYLSGTMRSGTTLVGSVLNAHSQVGVVSDTLTWFFKRAFGNYGPLKSEYELDNLLYNMLPFALHHGGKASWPSVRKATIELGVGYHNLYKVLVEAELGFPLPKCYGIKSTHSAFEYKKIIEGIPNTKIIHLVRDIHDVYASHQAFVGKGQAVWRTHLKSLVRKFRSGMLHKFSGKSLLLDEIAFMPLHFSEPRRMVDYWKVSNELAMEISASHPENLRIIRYEDLIRNVESVMRDAFEFIGVEWEEDSCRYEMLKGKDNTKWSANSSFDTRSIVGFDSSRIGNGAKRMDEQELEYIDATCGNVIEALGYKRSSV